MNAELTTDFVASRVLCSKADEPHLRPVGEKKTVLRAGEVTS